MAFTNGQLLRATGPDTAESVDILTVVALLEPYFASTGVLPASAKSSNYVLDDDNNRTVTNGLAVGTIEITLPSTPDPSYMAKIARTANFSLEINSNGKTVKYGEFVGTDFILETNGIVIMEYLEEEDIWFVHSITASQSGLS